MAKTHNLNIGQPKANSSSDFQAIKKKKAEFQIPNLWQKGIFVSPIRTHINPPLGHNFDKSVNKPNTLSKKEESKYLQMIENKIKLKI